MQGYACVIFRNAKSFYLVGIKCNKGLVVGAAVNDIVIGAGAMGFDSRAGQIGRTVAIGSSAMRSFFVTVLSGR